MRKYIHSACADGTATERVPDLALPTLPTIGLSSQDVHPNCNFICYTHMCVIMHPCFVLDSNRHGGIAFNECTSA